MASFGPKQVGKAQQIMKIKLSFRSAPTRPVIKNSKKIVKKLNKLKNIVMASFHAKIGWERQRKIENKNYRSYQLLPDP